MHALVELLTTIFPADDFGLIGVVLALPLLGAFVNGVFGKRLGKHAVRTMAVSVLVGSFLAALATFAVLAGGHEESVRWTAWHWLDLSTDNGEGTTPLEVAFMVDHLSVVMMLVITGVGSLIHLYASAYMWSDARKDGGYHRFFAYLNLFVFAMLVLVLGASLPILFVGWEGVGLCSYLLIGFWYSDAANAAAGKKAFIANRIGDFGLLVAMSLLLYYTGTLEWEGIHRNSGALLEHVQVWPLGNGLRGLPSALSGLNHTISPTVATVVALMLFLGCAGKSAQIPLYVWLPDAMAGPTPVSALIHAATMVTAGLYLMCRMSGVFLLSPVAMAVVATVGAATALFAASIGLVQNDIKKVLAYSTVSQLGFMFLGTGVGAFEAGFFHVFTHAFFKACLFLGAGSVIHAMHAGIHDSARSQDMRVMGGLRRYMPVTFATYLVSCLAIAGMPLTSGFFSKDEILYRAFANHIVAYTPKGTPARWEAPAWFGPALYAVGVLAATMTAFYMFRSLFLTFAGEFRGWKVDPAAAPAAHGDDHDAHDAHGGHDDHGHDDDDEHHHADIEEGPAPQESPAAMTWPLIVLAAFAAFAGFLNAGLLSHSLTAMEHWLEPVFEHTTQLVKVREGAPSELALAVPGVLAFLVGAGGAYFVYVVRAGEPAASLAAALPKLHKLVLDKWRIDELYEATVIEFVDALAETATTFDKWAVDGILARLSAFVVRLAGSALRLLQTGVVHGYAATMVVGLTAVGWFFGTPHAKIAVRAETQTTTTLEAAPGLGYRYRWHSRSPDKSDYPDWTLMRSVEVPLPGVGESRTVVLEVKNSLGLETKTTYEVRGPAAPTAANAPGNPDSKKVLVP